MCINARSNLNHEIRCVSIFDPFRIVDLAVSLCRNNCVDCTDGIFEWLHIRVYQRMCGGQVGLPLRGRLQVNDGLRQSRDRVDLQSRATFKQPRIAFLEMADGRAVHHNAIQLQRLKWVFAQHWSVVNG